MTAPGPPALVSVSDGLAVRLLPRSCNRRMDPLLIRPPTTLDGSPTELAAFTQRTETVRECGPER